MPDWLCRGIYRRRWQYWWPWNVTRPWSFSVWRGVDEYCNPSVVFSLPFLGSLVVFWRPGRLRTEGRAVAR